MYGVATAIVRVGYEYSDCGQIMWDTQTTTIAGSDISISEIGGWNLDIHHAYNIPEGKLTHYNIPVPTTPTTSPRVSSEHCGTLQHHRPITPTTSPRVS